MSFRAKFSAVAAVVSAVLALESRAEACAGCSNPNLPNARAGNTALAPGAVTLSLNLTGTTMRVVHPQACPDIGPICKQRAEPPQLHDQRLYVLELRPIVGVGITETFGAELQAPVRIVNTSIVFRRLDGQAFEADYESIHHRNETIAGIADPWLLGRATGALGKVRVTARAGVGLPLGRTEQNPFALGDAGLRHQHIQLGVGTLYPVFALDVSVPVGPRVRLNAYAQSLMFVLENDQGYRSGNRYSGGFSGDVEIARGFRVGVGADVLNEQAERWNRIVQQDGNVGRTDILAGGSISYGFGASSIVAAVRVPAWQHFITTSHGDGEDPGQLTYPAILNLAFHTTFDGPRSRK